MTSNTFPLFKVPKDAQRFVLKCMDSKQLIAFSILSNRAKTTIKELELSICWMGMEFQDSLNIVVMHDNSIDSFEFVPEIENEWEQETASTEGYLKSTLGILRKEGYTMENWTDHFRFVFNQDHLNKPLFEALDQGSKPFAEIRKNRISVRLQQQAYGRPDFEGNSASSC